MIIHDPRIISEEELGVVNLAESLRKIGEYRHPDSKR